MKTRKIITGLLAFSLLLTIGTFGYRFIEGEQWTYFDGLFMTVITLATVGFSEVHPLSSTGRMFTIFLLLLGAGMMAYSVTAVAHFIIEGEFRQLWGKRRMKGRIEQMKGHYILCGAGNTGMVVAYQLMREKIPFIIVDSNAKTVAELNEQDIPAIEGDATLDEVLIQVGLEKAAGLVTALPHDADNVFVTLTAKGLNPNVFVISSATKIEAVPKLKRAGANYVVSPNLIAGARMASVILRPSVVDFLDATIAGDDRALQMEEFRINPESYLANKALKDADIRKRSGAIIVSVRRNHRSIINPEPTYVFEPGDTLIVLGDLTQIGKFREMAAA
jgi:voltage-gated potassium channel